MRRAGGVLETPRDPLLLAPFVLAERDSLLLTRPGEAVELALLEAGRSSTRGYTQFDHTVPLCEELVSTEMGRYIWSMSRAAMLKRIEKLTDDEFERVEPYLAADLDVADDLPDMRAEIEQGLQSASTEPLLDHETVMAMGRARLRMP